MSAEPDQQSKYCDVADYTGYDSDDDAELRFGELNDLQLAAKQGRLEDVKQLCEEKRFDVNENNYRRWCAVSLAALFKHWDVVKYLVEEAKADIDNYTTDAFHMSALYYAVLYGNDEMCQFLLRHGAQVNQTYSANFEHPLHIAIKQGHTELFPTLLQAKANPNAELSSGRKDSVLSYAILNGKLDIIPLLQQYGATPSTENAEQGLYGFIEIAPDPTASFKAAFELTDPQDPTKPFYNGKAVAFGLYGCLRSRKPTADYIRLLLDFDQKHALNGVNSKIQLTSSWVSLILNFKQDKVDIVMDGAEKKEFTAYELAVIKNNSDYLTLIEPFADQQGCESGKEYAAKLNPQ